MSKIAVIIYGPPGSGKGTQANLLAGRKGFVHFDTGRYLEQFLHNPANWKNPEVATAKKVFDRGELISPSFVLKLTGRKTKEISSAGFNLVFSGSPRTMFEAVGDKNNVGLIKILEEEYGKKNLYPVFLKIKPEISIQRNKNRLICSVCATVMLYSDVMHEHKICPLCGGKLIKRLVDNPAIFKTRVKEYKERTFPILKELKKQGYEIININGSPLPYIVHHQIMGKLPL